jgi:2-amino-4-hydroxy-6-hydroxymethyldihydropteridine diphosphokinase
VTREPVTAFVGLGANLGDAARAVRDAIEAVDHLPFTRVTSRSGLYRTAPYQASGPDYVNAVVGISTGLIAPDLLAALQQLELGAGRERPFPNAPRTLDLDLLLYGSAQITSQNLTVPHPRLAERAFVLVPLAEIAPERVTAAQMLAVVDQRIVRFPGN